MKAEQKAYQMVYWKVLMLAVMPVVMTVAQMDYCLAVLMALSLVDQKAACLVLNLVDLMVWSLVGKKVLHLAVRKAAQKAECLV